MSVQSSTTSTGFFGRGRQLSISALNKSAGGGGGNRPIASVLNLSIQAYHSMNRFLTAFLEHALSDLDYDVKDKSFFETAFDMEFGELNNDRAAFYTDNGHGFDAVLFYGNERTLFMFNLYTFIFVDILSHNFVLAGIVTFILDLVNSVSSKIQTNISHLNFTKTYFYFSSLIRIHSRL